MAAGECLIFMEGRAILAPGGQAAALAEAMLGLLAFPKAKAAWAARGLGPEAADGELCSPARTLV